ncbi:hypothetical protein IE53DRAFT_385424 [Violaceomyces palustris]|uniref:Uncharacterized protein n=1 Tax=Violaceomyces palustris TaxID=1673888 RepID=A0ACD0P291_9BASI|nr:hypothetical protein IE53DRAFT_385424 [Violaceomyces palustris]
MRTTIKVPKNAYSQCYFSQNDRTGNTSQPSLEEIELEISITDPPTALSASSSFSPSSSSNTRDLIVNPPPNPAESPSIKGLAIIAHPLGRLGGNMDDPVVQSLKSYLLKERSSRVVTFNSRGVGQSQGSASWTGKEESWDYQFLLRKMIIDLLGSTSDEDGSKNHHYDLYLCGYSAGSLYASCSFLSDNSRLEDEGKEAYGIGVDFCRPGPVTADGGRRKAWFRRPRYILISYPLDMVWALSLFRSSFYHSALERLLKSDWDGGLQERQGDGGEREKRFDGDPRSVGKESIRALASDVLVIFGLQDQFTKESSYEKWTTKLSSIAPPPSTSSSPRPTKASSTFDQVRIDNSDHFWRSKDSLGKLTRSVDRWLRILDSS